MSRIGQTSMSRYDARQPGFMGHPGLKSSEGGVYKPFLSGYSNCLVSYGNMRHCALRASAVESVLCIFSRCVFLQHVPPIYRLGIRPETAWRSKYDLSSLSLLHLSLSSFCRL